MDAPDFDQNVVQTASVRYGPVPGERGRALVVPAEVAAALKAARLARSMSPAQEAASCHVPATLILSLEAGQTTEFRDENDLLMTVERVATFLGFPPGSPVVDILRAWSSAYATQSGSEIELREPLAPTQPLPLVSQPGSGLAHSVPGYGDASRASRPWSQSSGRGARQVPAEASPPPVRRQARGRRRLLVAIGAVAVVVVAAAFAVMEAGLPGTDRGHSGSSAPPLRPARSHEVSSPLVQKTSTGAGQATYAVSASSYVLTVRSDRPSWVRVGTTTGSPQFAGIVEPGAAERLTVGVPVQVQIGAGGTTVTVSSGHSSKTLTPPSAPYTYQLDPHPAGTGT